MGYLLKIKIRMGNPPVKGKYLVKKIMFLFLKPKYFIILCLTVHPTQD